MNSAINFPATLSCPGCDVDIEPDSNGSYPAGEQIACSCGTNLEILVARGRAILSILSETAEWDDDSTTLHKTRVERKQCGCMADDSHCQQHNDPKRAVFVCLCLCHMTSGEEV